MPIGSYYFLISKNTITKLLIKFFGILDLHTHIRLKPVFYFLRTHLNKYRETGYVNVFEAVVQA